MRFRGRVSASTSATIPTLKGMLHPVSSFLVRRRSRGFSFKASRRLRSSRSSMTPICGSKYSSHPTGGTQARLSPAKLLTRRVSLASLVRRSNERNSHSGRLLSTLPLFGPQGHCARLCGSYRLCLVCRTSRLHKRLRRQPAHYICNGCSGDTCCECGRSYRLYCLFRLER